MTKKREDGRRAFFFLICHFDICHACSPLIHTPHFLQLRCVWARRWRAVMFVRERMRGVTAMTRDEQIVATHHRLLVSGATWCGGKSGRSPDLPPRRSAHVTIDVTLCQNEVSDVTISRCGAGGGAKTGAPSSPASPEVSKFGENWRFPTCRSGHVTFYVTHGR